MRTLIKNYLACIRKYAMFKGHSTRAEYIALTLVNMAIINGMYYFGINTLVFGLVMFMPAISVTTRRLHDLNHSGWLGAIPWGIIFLAVFGLVAMPSDYSTLWWGIFWLGWCMMILIDIWLCLFRGKLEPNRYGESPLVP